MANLWTKTWARRSPVLFLLPPALALALAWPAISDIGLPTKWTVLLVVLPFYMGLLAGPGYIYELVTDLQESEAGWFRRSWIRISLILAFIASIGGCVVSGAMPLFAPVSLLSAYAAWLSWRRFKSERRLTGG